MTHLGAAWDAASVHFGPTIRRTEILVYLRTYLFSCLLNNHATEKSTIGRHRQRNNNRKLTLNCQTRKNIIRSQCMGNSQYRRQHYITYHTFISIAYLASPDSSGSLGIVIYFLRRKYPAGKAAKGLRVSEAYRYPRQIQAKCSGILRNFSAYLSQNGTRVLNFRGAGRSLV